MNKLGYFCQYTPLKVMLISVLLSCLLAIGIEIADTGTFVGASFTMIFFLAFVSINFILSLMSFSIYFNIYKKVRESIFLSFLSFYLPVILVILALTIIDPNMVLYHLNRDILYSILIISPFLIPQTYFFIRFRKMVNRGYFDDTDYDSVDLDHV